ncbi:MAG: hypothetical protein WCL00_01260 [Bacteroidota bacterium]
MKNRSYLCFLTLIFTAGIFFNTGDALAGNLNPRKETIENAKMKVIGIIGGVSWVSSMEYYKRLNEMARDSFGKKWEFPSSILLMLGKHLH